MEVIYCCYAGAHTSITAAALHIGLLNSDIVPSTDEITALPNFDMTPTEELGRVFKFGVDERGNNIYIAALGPNRKVTLPVLKFVLKEFGVKEQELLIIDALSCISLEVRVGGFLSRRLGLVKVGRPMCAKGIIKNFGCFTKLVREVKDACNNTP